MPGAVKQGFLPVLVGMATVRNCSLCELCLTKPSIALIVTLIVHLGVQGQLHAFAAVRWDELGTSWWLLSRSTKAF